MGFYIKNVHIDGQVVLAPMAGVTNVAYRKMCHDYGAALVYSEMISDKGIFYHDLKTLELMVLDENEHPVAIQIFGGDLETLLYAAKYVDTQTKADIIDINMGCSVQKILKSNAGSKYLLDPQRIYNTVKTIVDNVTKPVTVKVRLGYDHNNINIKEVATLIKKAGASAIAIHGRCRSDMFANDVNYQVIKEVKELLGDFPVIVNGSIKDAIEAKKILEYTGCDAVMIGRASYGNFFLFKQIKELLENNVLLDNLSAKERVEELKKYALKLIELKGEYLAIRELRKQAGWFIKYGFDSTTKRHQLTEINTYQDLLDIINNIEN